MRTMRKRALPLLGGEAVVHDWWWLLRAHGALDRDREVAAMIWTLGLCATAQGLAALLAGLLATTRPE